MAVGLQKRSRLCLINLTTSCIHLCSFSHAALPKVRALGLFLETVSSWVLLYNPCKFLWMDSYFFSYPTFCSFVHGNIFWYLFWIAPLRSAEASISIPSCYLLSPFSLPFGTRLQLNFSCIDFPDVLATSVQNNWNYHVILSSLFCVSSPLHKTKYT